MGGYDHNIFVVVKIFRHLRSPALEQEDHRKAACFSNSMRGRHPVFGQGQAAFGLPSPRPVQHGRTASNSARLFRRKLPPRAKSALGRAGSEESKPEGAASEPDAA
jgi:hypothetical protein